MGSNNPFNDNLMRRSIEADFGVNPFGGDLFSNKTKAKGRPQINSEGMAKLLQLRYFYH